MRYCIATGKLLVPQFHSLKGLCHPTRMREPMKTNLKKLACLFQVLSEILEGPFNLSILFSHVIRLGIMVHTTTHLTCST